jgi:hypothetical protein
MKKIWQQNKIVTFEITLCRVPVAQEITDLILNNCNIHNNFKTEDEIGI